MKKPKTETERKRAAPSQIQGAIRILCAEEEDGADIGYSWKVQIVTYGKDKNGTRWGKEPIVAAIPLYEGCRVFALREAQHQEWRHPYGKSVRDLVGWVAGVHDAGDGLAGTFHILHSSEWLRDMLMESHERGKPDLIALSQDVSAIAIRTDDDGKDAYVLQEVLGVTIDVVYEPAAGGKFLQMAAAMQREEGDMLKKLLAILKEQRADLYAALEAKIEDGSVSEDEILVQVTAALKQTADTGGDTGLVEQIRAVVSEAMKAATGKAQGGADGEGGGAGNTPNEGNADIEKLGRMTCTVILQAALRESGLPELSVKRLEKHFEGQIFEQETLVGAIKDEKEYVDSLTASGRPTGAGGIKAGEDQADKAIQMVDDFFERKHHSFKAAYVLLTGDEKVTGQMKAARRLTASLTTASFDQILGDSVTRKMVKEYAAAGLTDWRKIVDVVPRQDFRTNRLTRMGGYGNLPAVAQSGAYAALSSPTDEEATYAVSKRGGTEDITLEMIKNDDVGAIRRIPQRLGRAAARTLHEFAFDFLKDNPTIYDSVALFHADHGNLSANSLASAALSAARQAMLKQTEMDSSKRLGIPPRYIIVPIDLDRTAWDLVTTPDTGQFTPIAADFIKSWRIEPIVVPYWTDVTDWCLSVDPADCPTIEIGFLDGNEEPELFIQDMPTVGSMFSNDKLTYKIRHIYGGAVVDYRGLRKNVVA